MFKPCDEEPMAACNPRGFHDTRSDYGMRQGILPGEGAFREVAAFVLDHGHRAGVPATAMVYAEMPDGLVKYGSLQVREWGGVVPRRGARARRREAPRGLQATRRGCARAESVVAEGARRRRGVARCVDARPQVTSRAFLDLAPHRTPLARTALSRLALSHSLAPHSSSPALSACAPPPHRALRRRS